MTSHSPLPPPSPSLQKRARRIDLQVGNQQPAGKIMHRCGSMVLLVHSVYTRLHSLFVILTRCWLQVVPAFSLSERPRADAGQAECNSRVEDRQDLMAQVRVCCACLCEWERNAE